MNMIIQFPQTPAAAGLTGRRTVPDPIDKTLETLLAYPDREAAGDDLFIVDVMRHVQKERRTRKLILYLFGGIGALFGLAGAALLSDSIGGLFTETVNAMSLTQLPLFAAGAAAFYIWVMNDDLPLNT